MSMTGGCYCKAVRYEVTGDPAMKAQCFCRECQYSTGGDSLLVMGIPEANFTLTQGELKGFQRSDLENGVIRMFCEQCGTQIASKPMPGMLMLKVGSLDDPSDFPGPDMAIFTCDAQPFHKVPEDIPTFEKMPS